MFYIMNIYSLFKYLLFRILIIFDGILMHLIIFQKLILYEFYELNIYINYFIILI